MEVAAWREREAQTRDVPRSRVLKDDVVGDIAIAGADHASSGSATLRSLPEGLRALALGRRHHRGGQARARARSQDPAAASSARARRANGAATVELLKVLLRMTSERHGVAAKVIATVDDLDRIAADDEADVPALKGWRRELFGEQGAGAQARPAGAGGRERPRGDGGEELTGLGTESWRRKDQA